ncbi:nSTAND1 domain-containing NTPase [Gordonia rubripertincta]|uniref:Novel STAND NTPase 1 domain-containing protein n=1 Tax=Gordonia rubripertincta TaxID=36822 RepID=A0ABT4N4U0_GORRU|nr:hypothetical protein [Gordonia rubripertincta]MCZ4553331.1 hypothetical protein [Gordonia rubripertincta]
MYPETVQTREDLGKALTELRENAGLTVRELVEQSDALLGTVSGWLAGNHAPTAASKEMFFAVLSSCGVSGSDTDIWWAAVRRARRKVSTRSEIAPTPYRGFESFQTDDKEWFFGRKDVTDRLVDAVVSASSGEDPRRRMVMVVGPSGAGKSSVVRAGLLPSVGSASLAGWRSTLMVPGTDPVAALASAIADGTGAGDGPLLVVVDQLEELWTLAPAVAREEFLEAVTELVADGGGPGAVVVGVLRADYYARVSAVPFLVDVLQHSQVVVASMGVDQLREVITGPARRAGLDIDDDLVELLLADVAPAAGYSGATALPMLSHALLATWSHSDRRRLTVADYLATGRISGAVERTAEAVYADLDDAERDLARRQLLAMVNVDDEWVSRRKAPLEALGIASADPASAGDAAATLSPEAARAVEVLERFAAARLVSVDADYAEVTHEALLTAWPRLQQWIDGDRARLLMHKRFRQAWTLWESGDRADELLIRGAWLGMVNDFIPGERGEPQLTTAETAFLHASNEQQRKLEAGERRRVRQLRRIAFGVAVVALVAALAATLAVIARSDAVDERNRAEQLQRQALSRQLAVQSGELTERDPALARQLAMIAYRTSPTLEARSNLIDNSAIATPARFLGPVGPVKVAYSPGRGLLAMADAANRVTLYTTAPEATGPVVLGGLARRLGDFGGHDSNEALRALSFSADSTTLVLGGRAATEVWDVRDPLAPTRTAVLPTGQPVNGIALSPDGRTLVAAVEQVGVLGWQREGEQWAAIALPPIVAGTGQAVAFSRDGSILATSSVTRRVDLWTVSDSGLVPLPPIELTQWSDNQQALSLVFAPDGELAMGLKSHQVQFYALTAGGGSSLVRTIEGFGNYVNGISISDDGNRLAAAGSDNTVREFDLRASGNDSARIWHGPSTFTSVVYVGGEVVATADDGVVTAWQTTHPMIRLGSETIFQIPAGSRSPDILASSGPSGEVTRLRVSDGPNLVRVGPELAPPPDASFSGAIGVSATGRLAVLGSADGTVYFGDYSDEEPKLVGPGVRALQTLNETVDVNEDSQIAVTGGLESNRLPVIDVSDLSAPEVVSNIEVGEGVTWASLSPEGTSVALATPGGSVLLYDLTDPTRPRQLMTINVFDTAALAVRFRPDGAALLVTSSTKELATVDITRRDNPEITARLSGPVGQIYSGAYSSDGDTIVVGGGAGEIWTWDVSDERRPDLLMVLRAFGGKVFDVRFADDDRTVLAAGDGGAVMSWTVDTDLMLARACEAAGDQITEAEWRQYLPTSPYGPPCGG